jgi:hypothetical protein
MQQAVLHKAAPSNPVRELERLGESKGKRGAQPRALTIEERRQFLGWLDGTSNDPKVARPARFWFPDFGRRRGDRRADVGCLG